MLCRSSADIHGDVPRKQEERGSVGDVICS